MHGICGNYLYERETGKEVMMNDPRFLRAPTVFQAFYDAGAKVAVVTAKDKLRALLGKGLAFDDGRALCFSAEKSDTTTMAEHGIDNASKHFGLPVPEVYSAELSEFVFAAGVQLLKEFRPDVMYLTTTDYVQHKYAPGVTQANAFYEMFDRYLAELDALGAAIVVTADHGMKPKHKADGSPDVVYVQDLLDEWLGKDAARVILPITDPYVVHHGALGSFATAYLPDGADRADIMTRLAKVEGIMLVRRQRGGLRALRTAGGPHRRHRADLDREQGDRHQRTPARSGGAQRAAALAWRADRAGRAVHRQPRAAGPAERADIAQFRRVLLRGDGGGAAELDALSSPLWGG